MGNNTYWNNNGKYQKIKDKLKEQLCFQDEDNIRLYQAIYSIYYDCYNNGGCNLDAHSDRIDLLKEFCEEEANFLFKHRTNLLNRKEEIYLPDGWEKPLEKIFDSVLLVLSSKIRLKPEENIDDKYKSMVKKLCKSGQDIIDELTPEKAHLWHMACGVAGEGGELLDALKKHCVYGGNS